MHCKQLIINYTMIFMTEKYAIKKVYFVNEVNNVFFNAI